MMFRRYHFQRLTKLTIGGMAALFVITLYTFHDSGLSSENDRAEQEVQRQRHHAKESLKFRKLQQYQKLVFQNHKRPGDDVYNINITLAETMPLYRDIPDSRPKSCRSINYEVKKLPTLSVIIPFYNEALVMLLRTVHSILERTPAELLVDVILVNDHSKNADLDDRLVEYVKLLPDKVKLLKTRQREGLIRARMLGADAARGEVIMFQDAHTEVNVGWAEPMLYEISLDRKTVIQPEVDQIEQWTLEYIGSTGVVSRGGWSWDLRYVWMEIPDHEKERLQKEANRLDRRVESLPFRAAALVGCALMVNRDYFLSIGGFDESFNVWGGENIELAIRNWLCGGQVLTHPCSRVAHTFKPFSYQFDGDREKIVQKNLMRIAEQWMGDWKKFFYASTYSWPSKRTSFSDEELYTLAERKKLAKIMKCKPFDWYMKTIYPDVPTPPIDSTWYGEVTNLRTEACLYRLPDGYLGITYFCFFHRVLPRNLFHIDEHNRLMYGYQCVRIDYDNWLLQLGHCSDDENKEVWEHVPFDINIHPLEGNLKVTFYHPRDDGKQHTQCVTQVTNITPKHSNEQMPQLMACDSNNEFQKWRWQYNFDFNYDFGLTE